MTNTNREPQQPPTRTSNTEWRWVIVVSGVIILITTLPFIYAMWLDFSQPDVHFMGMVYNPLDGATHLAKIELGKEGTFRTYFRHSPIELEGSGAYITVLYNTIGNLFRYLGFSNVLAYHAVRLMSAFLMCLSLYHLGATSWRRLRNRRLFFLLVLVGSGFGWVYTLFGVNQTPDLTIPEAFPLYSAMTNPHFPLSLAFMALAVSIIIRVFRPGFREMPTIENGGLTLLLSSLALAIIAPHALIPMALAFGLVMFIEWGAARKVYNWQFNWLMMIILPAAPIAFYYLAEVRYNPVVAAWSLQNVNYTPSPWMFFGGFGIPLLFALPGIYHGVRHFEPDGDRFMLMWLVSILLMVYIPTGVQSRFSIGLMIPIAYFAIRTLDRLIPNISLPRLRQHLPNILVGASALTYILLISVGFDVISSEVDRRFYLTHEQVQALSFIEAQTDGARIVLAPPGVSLWIPALIGQQVVYAHPHETINASYNEEQVNAFYAATAPDDPICTAIMATFNVAYVLVDDEMPTPCTATLKELQQFSDVVVYAPE